VPESVLGTAETATPRLSALDELESVLAREDVAAAIIEPSGASWGSVPLEPGFCDRVRELTEKYSTLLIYDEMITGFRWAPGGAQERDGIDPDLTTLGKILTGGMPGGSVAGKAAILDALIPTTDPENGYVLNFGTFNGHPLSAAAGIASLQLVRDGDACRRASAYGAEMRAGLQQVIEEQDVAGFSYGEESAFHVYLVEPGSAVEGKWRDPRDLTSEEYLGIPKAILGAMTEGLRGRGVDFWTYNGGIGSAAHTDADLGLALDAFAGAFTDMKNRGLVARR
jgi:glutamate-1-semialdehyde 2,1-aminomutase